MIKTQGISVKETGLNQGETELNTLSTIMKYTKLDLHLADTKGEFADCLIQSSKELEAIRLNLENLILKTAKVIHSINTTFIDTDNKLANSIDKLEVNNETHK